MVWMSKHKIFIKRITPENLKSIHQTVHLETHRQDFTDKILGRKIQNGHFDIYSECSKTNQLEIFKQRIIPENMKSIHKMFCLEMRRQDFTYKVLGRKIQNGHLNTYPECSKTNQIKIFIQRIVPENLKSIHKTVRLEMCRQDFTYKILGRKI